LTKFQVNLTPGNILTASGLVNYAKAERVGLSRFTPAESTTDQHRNNFLFSLRDVATLPGHSLLETGIAFSQFSGNSFPRGTFPYVLAPEGTSGSFFEATDSRARRVQVFTNYSMAPRQWGGRHELRFGADVHRIIYRQQIHREPINIVDVAGNLVRQSTFTG